MSGKEGKGNGLAPLFALLARLLQWLNLRKREKIVELEERDKDQLEKQLKDSSRANRIKHETHQATDDELDAGMRPPSRR